MKPPKKSEVIPMRQDTNTRLSLLEQSHIAIIDILKDIKIEMKEMRNEMKDIRVELTKMDADLNEKIHGLKVNMMDMLSTNNKWFFTLLMTTFSGLIGSILGMIKYFIN